MKRGFKVFLITFIAQANLLFAQNPAPISLNFKPLFGNSLLLLNNSFYKINDHDSVQFETLKFYISGIELWKNSEQVWVESNSFHLLDAADSNSLKIKLKAAPDLLFTKIKFNLGIDSTTNVSGAMGGDLDPTKGMYWTWQNGYINFKLEGKCNLCQTRNNGFQFHLGGYAYPCNTLQTVTLPIPNKRNIAIDFDLKKLLAEIDLGKKNHIMSPNKEAVGLSNKLGELFKIEE